jgi:hypothetical protein
MKSRIYGVEKMIDKQTILAQITALAEAIELPVTAREQVQQKAAVIPAEIFSDYGRRLVDPTAAKSTANQLTEAYQKESFTELALYLYAAALSWETIYQPLHISKDIYIATMKAFTRFVLEHFRVTGKYVFDRGFWMWRYTSGLIFRLDELEFEQFQLPYSSKYPALNGKVSLSIHIPSDADLTPEKITVSYQKAEEFFHTHFPAYPYEVMYTETWLLSPNLSKWLQPTAKLYQFAQAYEILAVDLQDNSGIPWIFSRVDEQVSSYPEQTSLQRAAKAHLLTGQAIGSALGILRS